MITAEDVDALASAAIQSVDEEHVTVALVAVLRLALRDDAFAAAERAELAAAIRETRYDEKLREALKEVIAAAGPEDPDRQKLRRKVEKLERFATVAGQAIGRLDAAVDTALEIAGDLRTLPGLAEDGAA